MREIEVKVLEVSRDEVARGARLEFDGPMHALYFDTADRGLSRRRDSLRLRREGSRAVLNFKAHVAEGEMKVKEETETAVEDFEAARRILTGLGYDVWLEIEKHRLAYELGALPGVHFVFDRHVGKHGFVPEYLEVEAPSAELLREAIGVAGFAMDRTVPWNAFEVIEHYRKPRP
jgi:predicted adenylyl cyclase CyaB